MSESVSPNLHAPRLTTLIPNCIIRPWGRGDEASIVRNGDNPNVARNLVAAFPRPYTLQDAHAWISTCSGAPLALNLAIEYEGNVVGGVGGRIGSGEMRKTMSFGYWLGEPYWNRGIATAVVNAYIPYVFGLIDVERIEAHVFAPNAASARVLRKCGFSLEGTLAKRVLIEDHMEDEFVFARLRNQSALPL